MKMHCLVCKVSNKYNDKRDNRPHFEVNGLMIKDNLSTLWFLHDNFGSFQFTALINCILTRRMVRGRYIFVPIHFYGQGSKQTANRGSCARYTDVRENGVKGQGYSKNKTHSNRAPTVPFLTCVPLAKVLFYVRVLCHYKITVLTNRIAFTYHEYLQTIHFAIANVFTDICCLLLDILGYTCYINVLFRNWWERQFYSQTYTCVMLILLT